ncbi:MAG: nucleotidyltransferase domain-containing protein [Sedimentibacter sp.]
MIVSMNYSVSKITEEIINKFIPTKIILFGSIAKGIYSKNSDIDLCIIKDTGDKRALTTNIYTEIDCDIPFDIIIYTNEEWERNINDISSFAYIINKSGVCLYG